SGRIHHRCDSRPGWITGAKIRDANPRQHFLHRVIVTGYLVKEVIGVGVAWSAHMQHAVGNGVEILPEHGPPSIQGGPVEVILVAVNDGADIGGDERLRWSGQ